MNMNQWAFFDEISLAVMNIKTSCCEKYVDNVFCVVSRNVKYDLKNAIQICLLLKLFVTIRFRDHA
jgi:hypothetical protein